MIQILQGDVSDALLTLSDASFDAVLCDPPYGLSFMGKKWDYDVPRSGVWAQVLRVLRPGAFGLACGGTRTFHRLVCAIEDGGFEIRDQIDWIYGSGFPKSMNISKAIDKRAGAKRKVVGPDPSAARRNKASSKFSGVYGKIEDAKSCPITAPTTDAAKAWDGYGTALKPAHEPISLFRRAPEGALIDACVQHGVGGLDIDGTRVPYADESDKAAMSAGVEAIRRRGGVVEGSWKNSSDLSGAHPINDAGRWPANVILSEGEAVEDMDQFTGERPSTLTGRGDPRARTANPGHNRETSWFGGGNSSVYADSGGASHFFYVLKANRKERNAGCEHLPLRSIKECTGREEDSAGVDSPRAGAGRTDGNRNHHPTLKPITLMTYLARLILPPKTGRPRRILIPYSGSGSEIIGAALAGWDEIVGIEMDPEFVEIATARIAHWVGDAA